MNKTDANTSSRPIGQNEQSMNETLSVLNAEDRNALEWAFLRLERPSLAARLGSAIGAPIERTMQLLPRAWNKGLNEAAQAGIAKMLELTLSGFEHIPPSPSNEPLHRLLAMGAGAAGGFFGPLSLAIELPIVTALMLRSIADIAHSQGEDLSTPDARLACIQVFALGGRSRDDDAAETGYYGIRFTLSVQFSEAPLISTETSSGRILPAGAGLVRRIAARFGLVLSDKAATSVVPFVGAAGGGLVNLVFMQHFQDIARGHFIVRRLERNYGAAAVMAEYQAIARREKAREEAEAKSFSPLEGW